MDHQSPWLLVSLLLGFVALSQPCRAETAADVTKRKILPLVAEYEAELKNLRTQIDASLGARADLIEEYLDKSHALVYLAKAQANLEEREVASTNADLTRLVDFGYLSAFPVNPLSGWQPMRVLSVSDPFSEGDLVFEPCPAGAQTTLRGEKLSLSFNLYVYGLAGGIYEPLRLPKEVAAWACPPSGVLNGTSYYTSSDRENAENMRRSKERQRQRAAQSGS